MSSEQKLTFTHGPSGNGMSFELPGGRYLNVPEGAYHLLSPAFAIFSDSWGKEMRSDGNKKGKQKDSAQAHKWVNFYDFLLDPYVGSVEIDCLNDASI